MTSGIAFDILPIVSFMAVEFVEKLPAIREPQPARLPSAAYYPQPNAGPGKSQQNRLEEYLWN